MSKRYDVFNAVQAAEKQCTCPMPAIWEGVDGLNDMLQLKLDRRDNGCDCGSHIKDAYRKASWQCITMSPNAWAEKALTHKQNADDAFKAFQTLMRSYDVASNLNMPQLKAEIMRFYLSGGYAIECILKGLMYSRHQDKTIDDMKSHRIYPFTHDINKLIELSQLTATEEEKESFNIFEKFVVNAKYPAAKNYEEHAIFTMLEPEKSFATEAGLIPKNHVIFTNFFNKVHQQYPDQLG
jgi:hypothetical protein